MVIIGCLLVSTATWCSAGERLTSPAMDRVYYTRLGATYCGNMEYTSCGIRLWNCADERIYTCLHDVAYRDLP